MAVIIAYCKFSLKNGKTQKVADLLLSITFLYRDDVTERDALDAVRWTRKNAFEFSHPHTLAYSQSTQTLFTSSSISSGYHLNALPPLYYIIGTEGHPKIRKK